MFLHGKCACAKMIEANTMDRGHCYSRFRFRCPNVSREHLITFHVEESDFDSIAKLLYNFVIKWCGIVSLMFINPM